MALSPDTSTSVLEQLRSWRNADGGWGYAPGKRSRIEPTLLALLALGSDDVPSVVKRWRTTSGLLADGEALPVNFAFNGLALLLALWRGTSAVVADELATRLLEAKGIALEPSEVQRLDTRLQAWAWVDGTFSWVEPTAWCVLALKKWRAVSRSHEADVRIEEAERLLIDRTCVGGGWNYGSSLIFGKALAPYVPTTALGVLALQDRVREADIVKTVDLLARDATSEPSALSIGLAVIALHVAGRLVGPLTQALEDRMQVAAELGQLIGVATALYALGHEEHHCAAFRL